MKNKKAIFEEDDEDWLEDDGMETVDMVEIMTGFLKVQHQGALELTKLTLEYGKFDSLTKEEIFNIFQDAMLLMEKNIKNPIQ